MAMRTESSWVVALAFAFGCAGGEDGGVVLGSGGSSSSNGGSGGTPSSTGGTTGGSAPSGGTPSTGGSPATGTGGKSSTGTGGIVATGGSAMSGGSSATGGRGGGRGGSTGKGGAATGGSSTSTGGSGGASTCTQNIACKLAAPPTTGDIHQDCVDRINQFRTQCACLPPLARWTDGEACANQMAEYDSTATSAHAGFVARICSGGNAQDECPGWGSNTQVISGCLQSMWDEGPPPTSSCTGSCFNDHGHFINMSTTSNTKVACGFFTTPGGKVWAVQNFSR